MAVLVYKGSLTLRFRKMNFYSGQILKVRTVTAAETEKPEREAFNATQ